MLCTRPICVDRSAPEVIQATRRGPLASSRRGQDTGIRERRSVSSTAVTGQTNEAGWHDVDGEEMTTRMVTGIPTDDLGPSFRILTPVLPSLIVHVGCTQ